MVERFRKSGQCEGAVIPLNLLRGGCHADRLTDMQLYGGGDLRLVEDFVRRLQGEAPSISSTVLEDSIYGHLIGFAADQSMVEKRSIDIKIE
ncbi:MAG: hypothetical protein PWR01_976 [Clostridiales bacterium]|nr:hypothetical protein [Clostridiales bacterium]